jgi:integrase
MTASGITPAAWKGSVFRRKNKLWLKVKTPDGWKNVRTPFHVGEEKNARALLSRVRDRLIAGEELGDGELGRVTVRRWAKQWCDSRRETIENAAGDEANLRLHVLPEIGDMPLEEVRPRHTAALVRKWTAEGYAARTIRNVYYAMKAMFRDAAVDGLIDSNPCILGRAQLPEIVDADPEWRATAIYSRSELQTLIRDPRLPRDERVVHALLGLAGLRLGEMCGLRWRMLSLDMLPLGRIVVARSYMKRGTKTKAVRWMPIHPTLSRVLRDWFERGWESVIGRPPEPDDLVVPTPPPSRGKGRRTPAGQMRTKSYVEKHFWKQLDALGLAHRRVHDLRRTFISLAREDGADKDLLRRGTHQPPKDVMELYTTVEWRKLCEEVGKLRLPLQAPGKTKPAANRAGGLGTPLGTPDELLLEARGVRKWRRRESNPGPKDFQ